MVGLWLVETVLFRLGIGYKRTIFIGLGVGTYSPHGPLPLFDIKSKNRKYLLVLDFGWSL